MSARLALVAVLLAAGGAAAQYTVPVSDPKCVAACDEHGNCNLPCDAPATSGSSGTSQRSPEDVAARAAAEAEARRRAEEAARQALQEAEAVDRAIHERDLDGAALRDAAARFERYQRRSVQREAEPARLRDEMSPLPVVVPAAQQPAPATSTAELVKRLNEEARARQRGLQVKPPPPLPPPPPSAPTAGAPAFAAPPLVPPSALTAFVEAAEFRDLRDVAGELAKKQFWYWPEKLVPGLKTLRSVLGEWKSTFTALRDWNQRTLEGTFGQAHDVAFTLGSGTTRATVTNDDNDALLQRQGGDLNDTTAKLLSDKLRGSFLGKAVQQGNEWLAGGDAP